MKVHFFDKHHKCSGATRKTHLGEAKMTSHYQRSNS